MPLLRYLGLSLFFILLCGCISQPTTTTTPVNSQSFVLNQVMTVPVGTPFVERETGSEITVAEAWPMGHYTIRNTFLEQLIYGGRSGDTINVSYREFKKDLARPAFTQDLSYSLKDSNRFRFRDLLIEVKKADNENITFVVVEAKSPTSYAPPESSPPAR